MNALDPVWGRILDTDSHEWITVNHFEAEFGPATAPLASMAGAMSREGTVGQFLLPIEKDEGEIDLETLHRVKGPPAPGAMSMERRLKVLDLMGIDRQLIFGSGPGVFGPILATSPLDRLVRMVFRDLDLPEADGMDELCRLWGGEMSRAHNDWCIRVAALDDRLRPVAVIDPSSIPDAIAEVERVVEGGVRAVAMPSDTPPGGVSPASEAADPFWRLFTEADVPLLLHIGGEFNFQATTVWGDIPAFENQNRLSEIPLDPYSLSVCHLAAQNLLTAMVLGGVFERHPTLRFGVIELSSHWLGPMADNLTRWADQFAKRLTGVISLSPREYLQRNVRVSSFFFEPVDEYIDRYGLEDVYTFGSDYPHIEGGVDPAPQFAERLRRLGPTSTEKFFVTNGELLLPPSRPAGGGHTDRERVTVS